MFLGRGAGEELDKALRTTRERIMVLTPAIDEKYAELLARRRLEGVPVYVITSDENRSILKTHGKKPGLSRMFWKFIEKFPNIAVPYVFPIAFLAIVMVDTILRTTHAPVLLQYMSTFGVFATSIGVIILLMISGLYDGPPGGEEEPQLNLDVKLMPREQMPINAKLYIAGDRAWAGSVDLTEQSMWRSYEFLTEVDVKAAKKMFMELWNALERGQYDFKMSIDVQPLAAPPRQQEQKQTAKSPVCVSLN